MPLVESQAPHSSTTAKAAPAAPAATWKPARKFRVGVLGATGAVGQRFIEYLVSRSYRVVAVGGDCGYDHTGGG